MGTRQLTPGPSITNSLQPSPNLVSSEVPASGHHGFVKWGHDAKITKIGVIPTRGSPSQVKANSSRDRRPDPFTYIRVHNLKLGPGSLWAKRYGAAKLPRGGG